ncbi:MAG: hypothetical protein ACYC1M_02385 [Armatimonadota bacterium]
MLQATQNTLLKLHQLYPTTPFLALGQTALWDETVKASLCYLIDQLDIKHRFIVAAHDTDYFAKLPGYNGKDDSIISVAHNDGSTRELWSAAGELSALFGSETIPSRDLFAQHHVSLEKASQASGKGHDQFVDEITEAWGWKGLVHTGFKNLLSAEVCTCHGVKALLELYDWAIDLSLPIVGQERAEISSKLRTQLLTAKHETKGCLSDLFQRLFVDIMKNLYHGCELETSCSMELFKFNSATYHLPRFSPVSLFINPETRMTAETAYHNAVLGSDIYTLDKFGMGAIPFDVASLGMGRGTLMVRQRAIEIEFDEPIIITTAEPVTTLKQLAEILEDRFGPSVALIGKAVSLISMITQEFIPVMNEEGSAYVFRTKMMHDEMNSKGVSIQSHPILRLTYPTWDALQQCGDMMLSLPPHLAQAFGNQHVSCEVFGRTWREVVAQQERMMELVSEHRAPRDAVQWIQDREGGEWSELHLELTQCMHQINALVAQAQQIAEQTQCLFEQVRESQDAAQKLEHAKSEHYREFVKPLREKLYELRQQGLSETDSHYMATQQELIPHEQARLEFDSQISVLKTTAKEAKQQAAELKPLRMQMEKGPENKALRQKLAQYEAKIELRRSEILRDAYLVSHGLTHTQHRPTGWWIPLVDPSGRWFTAIAEGTSAYLQDMS